MKNLYILNQENTDLYKIGYTKNNVKERVKQLQTGSPLQLNIIFEYKSKFSNTIEKTLHRFMSHLNVNGEWFFLSQEDLCHIKEQIPLIENNLIYLETNKI